MFVSSSKLKNRIQNRTFLVVVIPGGRGGGLPYNRLMGMCRWMGSHFHDWNDHNGVAFSIESLEWGRTFFDFRGKTGLYNYG